MAAARHLNEVAELREVTKDFSGKPVLRGVSLQAYTGEILLVRGQSGSGKSTALRILAGIEAADSGTVHLFGEDVTSMSAKSRQRLNARRIGLGFQEPLLDRGFSVLENLVGLGKSFGKLDPKRIGLVATKLNLGDMLGEQAATLSGGEKQRLALGRLFVTQPELVLLDEPTASIDPSGKEDVYQATREFVERDGSSAIIISHDVQALEYADRIIEIESGSVVASQHS